MGPGDLAKSVESIAALQLPDGLILWNEGGHADPWNHVETAMALDIGGRHGAATRAYEWLMANQLPDGGWHQYYTADGVEDAKFDANTIAYIASGVWHHHCRADDGGFLSAFWPTVERAIDWVVAMQQPTGEIHWAREPDGTPFHYALVTGSSSIYESLGHALSIAAAVGKERPDWTEARERLATALRHHEREFFAEKDRWAMDWYYPVLTGVLAGPVAAARMDRQWTRFVHEGVGVRCVDDHDWVTTGETAECAMSLARIGDTARAAQLLEWIEQLRANDGSYFTGLAFPDNVHFPADERTTYSTAAVVLAHDALDSVAVAAAAPFRLVPSIPTVSGSVG